MRFTIMTFGRHAEVYVYFALRVNTSCNCHFLTRIVQKNHTSFKVLRNDTKLFSIVFRIKHLNSVADPGFPRGVGANPTGGGQHTILPNFPKKLHEIERIWIPRVPRAPLRSATEIVLKIDKEIWQEGAVWNFICCLPRTAAACLCLVLVAFVCCSYRI